jgi:hypothetical protein
MSKILNDTVSGVEASIIYDANTEVITPINSRWANARTITKKANQNRESSLCSVPLGPTELFMFSAEAGISLYAQILQALSKDASAIRQTKIEHFTLAYCTDNFVYMAEIQDGLVNCERVIPAGDSQRQLVAAQSKMTVFLHTGDGLARTTLLEERFTSIGDVFDLSAKLRYQWTPLVMLRHGFPHPVQAAAFVVLGLAIWGFDQYQERGSQMISDAANRAKQMADLNSTLVVDVSGGVYLERIAGLIHGLRLSGVEHDLPGKIIAEGNLLSVSGSWTQGYPTHVSKYNKGNGVQKQGFLLVNETGWLLQLEVDATPVQKSVAGIASEELIPLLFSTANELFSRFTITETTTSGLTGTVKFAYSVDNVGEDALLMLAQKLESLPVRVDRTTCEFQLSNNSLNCQIEGEAHYATES